MTTLDWLIVAFTLLFAAYGFLQGFVIGALSLAGFALGAVLGTRFGPALLSQGSRSPYAPLFGLAGALLAGGILASGLEGVGARLRRWIRLPGFGVLDGLLGAVLTGVVALGIVWITGAVVVQAAGPGGVRRQVRGSVVLRRLNDLLPPSGPILHALARLDPLPSVRGPEAAVGPPPRGIGRDPQVRAARASVVRVLGTACGVGVEGSGWVAPNGLVVTNAHVVAGEEDTTVQARGEGDRLAARVVVFDPHIDIALLRVKGLAAPALPLARAAVTGAGAAVLGFPGNGPFRVRSARLGATRSVLTQDAYGRGPVRRSIVTFRGLVQHGNSGGPLIDARGRVAGTVFASVIDRRPGGFAVPDAVVRAALRRAGRAAVGAGPCAG